MKISHRCPYEANHLTPKSYSVIKAGTRHGRLQKTIIQRFKCKSCNKYFTSRTILGTQKQKRPELNEMIFVLYSKGTTLRGIAKILKCSKNTVAKKFKIISQKCKVYHEKQLEKGYSHNGLKPLVVFDEMETHEQTLLKPLSIGVSYDFYNKKIIHMNVAEMVCRGRTLNDIWNKVAPIRGYRDRVDGRSAKAVESFLIIDEYTRKSPKLVIVSDAKPLYKNLVRFFPSGKVQHFYSPRNEPIKIRKVVKTKMRKASSIYMKPKKIKPYSRVVGATSFPRVPFSKAWLVKMTNKYERILNSSMARFNKFCAVLRSDMSRLRRTTYINTQKPEMLQMSLYLFIANYNGYNFHQIMTFRM